VGSVIVAAAEEAKKDGVKILFSGLGSEEIFAGYERHKVKDVNQECWRGLGLMWDRDMVRDFAIANKLNIELRTPFLDSEVIKAAMQIPGNKKLNKRGNKLILREIASDLGLGEFAFRKKVAAQYGSNIDRAILKLAKKKGFKFKKDSLQSFS
jgi:asparagine synthase (glutamine-hydrolysing)